MSVFSIIMALSFSLIQNSTGSTDSIVESASLTFTADIQSIRSLSQAKDAIGLENMAVTLKARWKDTDIVSYSKLIHELLGCLRTDFYPVDYGKIKAISEDVLADLETRLKQGVDPVLVPYYSGFQDWYIGATYGTKYYYAAKGDKEDGAWVNQRTEMITRLLKAWKFIQDTKDPTWAIDMSMPSMNVQPPDGGPAGISPSSVGDPKLRAQYVTEIHKVGEKHKWWGIQYNLWKTERDLRKSLLKDIQVMYNTPPLAPDELKSLLDQYVKDEEQKKMFLEASQKQEP